MLVVAKILNRLLLNRLYPVINEQLRVYQAGFRKNNCAEQIHVLERILEGFDQKQLPLVISFVDFQKAFDSVDRAVIWAIFKHYGLFLKIILAIKCFHVSSVSRVKISRSLSRPF